MGVQVAKKKRKRRQFSDEYKAEVVELIRTSGKSIGSVCRDMDLGETVVRRWVEKAEEAVVVGTTQKDEDMKKENAELRKRVKELEMERSILKKAAAFFAKESS